MAQDKQPTRIVLRRWKDNRHVIAIMPGIAEVGTIAYNDKGEAYHRIDACMSYMHLGQHGAASPGLQSDARLRAVMVKPGQPVDGSPVTEPMALLLELARIGYLPKVGRYVMRDTGVMEVWHG